jgi:uncharacterized protein (DUF433 family)
MSEATLNPQPPLLHVDRPSLCVDETGVIRVGRSRITLDLVIEQYENGMTPEELVQAYDTLDLADVHGAIAYYLRHRADVRAYMARREQEAKVLRAAIEEKLPPLSRSELKARVSGGK